MALAMAMDLAGTQHVGFPTTPPGARRWGAGRQRFNNNNIIPKVMKSQGLKPQKNKRRFNTRRSVPRAPYNDSSFLMRVRKAGGLESQIVALTPSSFMSTPKDSSYKLDTYEEDYGYGSMTGLIRLRPNEDDGGSSSSTVENEEPPSVLQADSMEQLERRLDRFEMTRPRGSDVLKELRAARQDCHVKCLEDENLVLKDRLSAMQQEINELRQRLHGGQFTGNADVGDDSQSCLGR